VTQDGGPRGDAGGGTVQTGKKSPAAWSSLLHALIVDVPNELRRSAKYRALILRGKR